MRFVLSLLVISLVGCDAALVETDGGVERGDASDPPDAGSPVDPTSARFRAATTDGDGPWGLWGFLVAPVDDSRAIVIGGTDAGEGTTTYDSVFRVEATAGGLTATRIDATGPAPRYCGCAAYDPVRDRVVIYGGRDLTVNAFAPETWALDLGSETWTELSSATQPTGTLGCAMAWSPSAEAIYMFGGADGFGAYAETHRLDADAGVWTPIAADGPVARYDAALLASHDGESLLLFGGSYGAMGAAFYADLWRFDPSAETWTEIPLPEGPVGRRTPWIVRDPDRLGLYVGFGYDGAMQPLGDLWYVDLEARSWTELALPFETAPSPRGFSYALPGGPDALAAIAGGFSARRPVSDAWLFVR